MPITRKRNWQFGLVFLLGLVACCALAATLIHYLTARRPEVIQLRGYDLDYLTLKGPVVIRDNKRPSVLFLTSAIVSPERSIVDQENIPFVVVIKHPNDCQLTVTASTTMWQPGSTVTTVIATLDEHKLEFTYNIVAYNTSEMHEYEDLDMLLPIANANGRIIENLDAGRVFEISFNAANEFEVRQLQMDLFSPRILELEGTRKLVGAIYDWWDTERPRAKPHVEVLAGWKRARNDFENDQRKKLSQRYDGIATADEVDRFVETRLNQWDSDSPMPMPVLASGPATDDKTGDEPSVAPQHGW